MKLLWILALIILFGAGVAFAVQKGLIALPSNLVALQNQSAPDLSSSIASIDGFLAGQIRTWREDGWETPEILGAVSQSIQQAGQSTISATVSTTPEEMWQSFREQGAQAALGKVVESAEVSVNTVSQNVLNEARYQYCLGVVEARN